MGDEAPVTGPAEAGGTERLLEVLVYAPVGAVLSAAEELPHWRERGRKAVAGQVATARVVGELAVRFGRRRLDEAVASWTTSSSGREAGAADLGGDERVEQAPAANVVAPVDRDAGGAGDATGRAGDATGRTVGAAGSAAAAAKAAHEPGASHVPPVGSLAIPGFDTLSASQVVPRLDGLGRADLVAVRAYETAHRRRRTVLGRVDQLLAERA
ncbi:MAG: hypothetical protein M0032_05350 [Actinomycetota bacterium]|nr:hypothetical protein [Actinomycetota bacterium]